MNLSLNLDNQLIDISRGEEQSDEDYFIDLVRKSNLLYLLKSDGIYHLRYEGVMDSSNNVKDMVLVNYLLTEYKMKFDEDFSQRKSGDINRSVISSGVLLN